MIFAEREPGELLFAGLWFSGLLLLGAFVVMSLQRWRRRRSGPGPTDHEQMSEFRRLHDRGAMSEEEFRRVRMLLTGRIQEKLKSSPPTTEGAAAKGPDKKEGDDVLEVDEKEFS